MYKTGQVEKSVKCFQKSAADVPEDVVKLPQSDPLIALVVALRIVKEYWQLNGYQAKRVL